MELVIRKGDLLRELQLLQGIIERRASVPILANILLKAADGEVLLLATDLDVGLRSRCEASVARPGTVTLPARKVLDIVKALPETDVRIEEDQGGVKLAADRFESRMSTLPADDFPALPAVPEGAASEVLPGGVLRLMVELTQFAITGEDTRYFLNGALFLCPGAGRRTAGNVAAGRTRPGRLKAAYTLFRSPLRSTGLEGSAHHSLHDPA